MMFRATTARLLTLLAIGLGLFVTIVIINQIAEIILLGYAISPWLGHAAVGVALTVLGVFILWPLWRLMTLPKILIPPEDTQSPEYQVFQDTLRRRLRKHPTVLERGLDVDGEGGLREALAILDEQSNKVIRDTSAALFISTAVSQNGRLDTILVLVAQLRMVWQIAQIYAERPGWRDMLSLYNNVAVTALIAGQIEDADLSERIEPVIRSAIGSGVAGMVPGTAAVTTVLLASTLDGTANAFLTLRVGLVARRYCSSLHRQSRREISRSAIAEAATMLGGVAYDCSKTVSAAVALAARKAGTSAIGSVQRSVMESAGTLFDVSRRAGDLVRGKPRTVGDAPLDAGR
jgi:uncharacterized membrane protein YcjF (UPF0283 family)